MSLVSPNQQCLYLYIILCVNHSSICLEHYPLFVFAPFDVQLPNLADHSHPSGVSVTQIKNEHGHISKSHQVVKQQAISAYSVARQ